MKSPWMRSLIGVCVVTSFASSASRNFFQRSEDAALALGADLVARQIVNAQPRCPATARRSLAACGTENVIAGEHQHGRFNLALPGERNMYRHLIAVKISIESRADERNGS